MRFILFQSRNTFQLFNSVLPAKSQSVKSGSDVDGGKNNFLSIKFIKYQVSCVDAVPQPKLYQLFFIRSRVTYFHLIIRKNSLSVDQINKHITKLATRYAPSEYDQPTILIHVQECKH